MHFYLDIFFQVKRWYEIFVKIKINKLVGMVLRVTTEELNRKKIKMIKIQLFSNFKTIRGYTNSACLPLKHKECKNEPKYHN